MTRALRPIAFAGLACLALTACQKRYDPLAELDAAERRAVNTQLLMNSKTVLTHSKRREDGSLVLWTRQAGYLYRYRLTKNADGLAQIQSLPNHTPTLAKVEPVAEKTRWPERATGLPKPEADQLADKSEEKAEKEAEATTKEKAPETPASKP